MLQVCGSVVDANVVNQVGEEGVGADRQQPVYWRIVGHIGNNQWRRRPKKLLDLPFIASTMKEVWPGGAVEMFECDILSPHDSEDTYLTGRL